MTYYVIVPEDKQRDQEYNNRMQQAFFDMGYRWQSCGNNYKEE